MNRQHAVIVVVLVAIGAFALARGAITSETLVLLAVLVPSIILHEVSHGASAYAFGDDTAKRAGRLTLNPIAHIDLFGTLILPAILILTTGAGFGFAKPVPINPRRMRDPRNHALLTALAGPAVNIVLALLSALVIRLYFTDFELVRAVRDPEHAPVMQTAVVNLGLLNVILAAFNLIPVPPLDGSAVVERVLPVRWWPRYLQLRQYSMGILLLIIFWLPGTLNHVFEPAFDVWEKLLR